MKYTHLYAKWYDLYKNRRRTYKQIGEAYGTSKQQVAYGIKQYCAMHKINFVAREKKDY